MTLATGTRLGSYEILAPLGAGGMGEVYRARDSKLDRDVAVKVLPAQLTSSPDALARFEREAKAVAALSHPNILSIFDFGTHGGVSYAVTELLEGETLRGKIDSAPVTQRQAVDWSLQIAKGLSAAHGKGVVHRDLKPDNVFVSRDGHVKILDFGLAKRVDAGAEDRTSAPTDAGHTEPGTVMGTMGYMSPEQLRGLTVDQRSDIFSFGAILYELLSGRKAFKRNTASDTIAAVLKEEPPELTESGRNVSPALDHLVRHCLEKDPENRFQTAKDVAYALSEASSPTTASVSGAQPMAPAPRRRTAVWIAAAAAVVALAAAGLLLSRRPKSGAPAAAGVKRVAVLPFENLGAAEDDYFADGIADAIRGKLASVPGLEVVARGSSTPYKKTAKLPKEIAKELDVGYLLTATVRWQKAGAAQRVQVSPELVEIKESGAPATKWQQPFDASLTDVFQVQSDIAAKVVDAIGVALADKQQKSLAGAPTSNVAAYDAYLKGEDVTASTARADPPSLRKGLGFYEQAVALDPNFADAWARVSVCRTLLFTNSVPDPALASGALEAAHKAMDLAPGKSAGYVAIGLYDRAVSGDLPQALEALQWAQKLVPNDPDVLRSIGRVETQMGRWKDAIAHYDQVERLDPKNPINVGNASQPLAYTRRCGEAVQAVDRNLALEPANLYRVAERVTAELCGGDAAGAKATVADAVRRVGPADTAAYFSSGLEWLLDADTFALLRRLTPAAFDGDEGNWALAQAWASWRAGDAAAARSYAEKGIPAIGAMAQKSPKRASVHVNLSQMYALAGRKADAVREGLLATELEPLAKSPYRGMDMLTSLAQTYVLLGDADQAAATLERILKGDYWITPATLKVDPTWDSIRQNPRFQKLVASK
jgi:TolB-like protein/tetratricopeptide (TPR) repeat protein